MKKIYKQLLRSQAKKYRYLQRQFVKTEHRHINSFNLKPQLKKQLEFGIVLPFNFSLKKYTDELNCNEALLSIRNEQNEALAVVYNFIISFLDLYGIIIPGYQIEILFEHTDENFHECEKLVNGLIGVDLLKYENGKIKNNGSLRNYITNYPVLISILNYWSKKSKLYK